MNLSHQIYHLSHSLLECSLSVDAPSKISINSNTAQRGLEAHGAVLLEVRLQLKVNGDKK